MNIDVWHGDPNSVWLWLAAVEAQDKAKAAELRAEAAEAAAAQARKDAFAEFKAAIKAEASNWSIGTRADAVHRALDCLASAIEKKGANHES